MIGKDSGRGAEKPGRGVHLRNKLFGFMYAMNYIVQAAWSFVFPAGLIIGLGYLVRRRFETGDWVMVVTIILGVFCGVYSMFHYIIKMADYASGNPGKQDKRKK